MLLAGFVDREASMNTKPSSPPPPPPPPPDKPVDLSESVAGEEDPGASLDVPPAARGQRRKPQDRKPPSTPR